MGMTATAAHCSYMQNRLGRDVVGIISMTGSAMYDEDLAASIKEHFGDIVDEFNAADAKDDESDGQEDDAGNKGVALSERASRRTPRAVSVSRGFLFSC